MIPRKKHAQEEGTDSWLMSYADMITLLMCFFIIFVSVSEPKREKFTLITQGLANKFGSVDLSTPFEGVFRSLLTIVENKQAFKDIAVEKGERSIEMELSSGAFFKKGSAEIDAEKLALLGELADSLKGATFVDYRIIVEGHTSDEKIDTPLHPSNWELSADRASRIVRFFIERGIEPRRMKAVGMADIDPKVPNRDTGGSPILENRAQNERIVIKFERVL